MMGVITLECDHILKCEVKWVLGSIACVLNHFSGVQLFATLWTIAHHAPPSMGFSKQEYWSRLSCPPPGSLPNPGTEPMSLISPALAGQFFATGTAWEVPRKRYYEQNWLR